MEKIDQLYEFQMQKTLLEMDKRKKLDAVLTHEIMVKMQEIEAEFQPMAEAVDANIAKLTAEVEKEVLEAKGTITGQFLQAVYNSGKVSWDSKILEGLLIAIPALAKAKKTGKPYISFRKR